MIMLIVVVVAITHTYKHRYPSLPQKPCAADLLLLKCWQQQQATAVNGHIDRHTHTHTQTHRHTNTQCNYVYNLLVNV